MRFAFVAGIAPLTRAFLLPPSVSPADFDIINNLPLSLDTEAYSRTLNLECLNCPFATLGPSGIEWTQGIKSKLQLQFSIGHDDANTLYLNDLQIYPPKNHLLEPLAALQIRPDAPGAVPAGYLRLGYELGIRSVAKSDRDQLQLIAIQLQIVEVGDKFVDGLENIELKLLKTWSGNLMIEDLETTPTKNPGGIGCTTLICKLRTIIANKLSHIKPANRCGSKDGTHEAHHVSGHYHGNTGGGHGRRHKHQGLARFLLGLKRVALHVLVPVLIGITVGFAASLVGMLVGQAIVLVWRIFYRHSQKGGYLCVPEDEDTIREKDKDQAEAFPGYQEPPPVYEIVLGKGNMK